MNNVINVTFVAFPDGTSIWFESNQEYLKRCVASWKDSLSNDVRERYERAGVDMLAGQLRMLREDYNRIPTTNQFKWPSPTHTESDMFLSESAPQEGKAIEAPTPKPLQVWPLQEGKAQDAAGDGETKP